MEAFFKGSGASLKTKAAGKSKETKKEVPWVEK